MIYIYKCNDDIPFFNDGDFRNDDDFYYDLILDQKTPIYIVCLTQNHIKNEGTKVIMKQSYDF
jgi:hypothetical protein